MFGVGVPKSREDCGFVYPPSCGSTAALALVQLVGSSLCVVVEVPQQPGETKAVGDRLCVYIYLPQVRTPNSSFSHVGTESGRWRRFSCHARSTHRTNVAANGAKQRRYICCKTRWSGHGGCNWCHERYFQSRAMGATHIRRSVRHEGGHAADLQIGQCCQR